MKFKSQLLFIVLIAALPAISLAASSITTATPSSHQYGIHNSYSIGEPNSPVTVQEYLSFLFGKFRHCNSLVCPFPPYYDSSFMARDQQDIHDNICIQMSWDDNLGGYTFQLLPQVDPDATIVGVASSDIQREFKQWRNNNPTRQELCDYINFRIAALFNVSYDAEAQKIASCYPNIEKSRMANSETVWLEADEFVRRLYGYDNNDSTVHVDTNGALYTTVTHFSATPADCNTFINYDWKLELTTTKDPTFNLPSQAIWHVAVMDGANKNEHANWIWNGHGFKDWENTKNTSLEHYQAGLVGEKNFLPYIMSETRIPCDSAQTQH